MLSYYHDNVIMSSCHHVNVIMLSCYHAIMLSCFHVIMLSCYHVIMLSCYHVIMLSCYHVIMITLSGYHDNMLSYFFSWKLHTLLLQADFKEESLLQPWSKRTGTDLSPNQWRLLIYMQGKLATAMIKADWNLSQT
jgi:hypothetical protein